MSALVLEKPGRTGPKLRSHSAGPAEFEKAKSAIVSDKIGEVDPAKIKTEGAARSNARSLLSCFWAFPR